MYVLLCICLFIIGFFVGGFFFGILILHEMEDRFFVEFTRFENRVDFSFEKYFGFPLFPKENK